MKNLLQKIFLSVLALFFSQSAVLAIAAEPGTPTIDPTATYPSLANKYYSIETDGTLCQKFKPSRAVIASFIDIRAAGSNPTGTALVLHANTGAGSGMPGQELNTYYAPAVFNDGRNTMSRFSASTYAPVTAGEYYWICLYSRQAVYWYATSPDDGGYTGTYDYGFAQIGAEQRGNVDFGFSIYSSDWVALENIDPDPVVVDETPDPVVPPVVVNLTPAASTPLPTGVTAGSGQAPVAPTTAIKAPTSLTIGDVSPDEGGSLILNWVASTTTDIDGYKVFRSEEETKNFTEVAKTVKTVLTYTDNSAEIGKKYFYFVRSYKTTKESVSSNTVNGISIDNVAPKTPQNPTYTKESPSLYNFAWEKNVESDLSGYSLIVTDPNDPSVTILTIEIPKDSESFALDLANYPDLDENIEYGFQLTAKDTQENLSEEALVQGIQEKQMEIAESAPVEKNNNIWYIIGGGTVLLLGLIGGGLYWWFKGRKKLNPVVLNKKEVGVEQNQTTPISK